MYHIQSTVEEHQDYQQDVRCAGDVPRRRRRVEPAEAERFLGGGTAAPRHFTPRRSLYVVAVQLEDRGASWPSLRAVPSVVALIGAAPHVRPRDIWIM